MSSGVSASRPVSRRARTRTVLGGAAIGAVLAGLTIGPGAAADAGPTSRIVVRATSSAAAAAAVAHAGGVVTIDLPIVDGVAATVATAAIPALRADPAVRTVTPDGVMRVQEIRTDTDAPASVYRQVVRVPRLAKRGGTGEGVTVAVLDTGISPTPDLLDRVLPIERPGGGTQPCVNLSGEPTCADGYGHGTFMAGLIAGDGTASDGRYRGAAPAADLVSIKVAARDGSADVSNVLAGIQWVVSFRDRYDIRVLNLSLGTDSEQSWRTDPLNYAVERAWQAGVAVVVAASNRGPDPETISKPGDDPWVITVGATDDVETVRRNDDLMPDFSSRGPTREGVAKPDVVAPGAHLVSLRAHGSTIDEKFPYYIDDTYRRGSGTSMATAVVSGVAAAVLSVKPGFSPDRLKFTLAETARPVTGSPPEAIGHGMINGYAAAFRAPRGKANHGLAESTGEGSLDLSRGDVRVTIDTLLGEIPLEGEITAQNQLWDLLEFLGLWDEESWYGSTWYLGYWLNTAWYGETWEGHNWEGCTKDGAYEDDCWYGHNWEGSAWYGAWDGPRPPE